MKTLTGSIVLMLALLFGASHVAVAAEKAAAPVAPAAAKRADNRLDVASKLTMTGKVTEVNKTAKTFTVMSKGKAVTFSSAKLKAPPTVGAIIDITYTDGADGPMHATSVKSSKSNSQD